MTLQQVEALHALGQMIDATLLLDFTGRVAVESISKDWLNYGYALSVYRQKGPKDCSDGWEFHCQKEGRSFRKPRFWHNETEDEISVAEAFRLGGERAESLRPVLGKFLIEAAA